MDFRPGCPDKIFDDCGMCFLMGAGLSHLASMVALFLPRYLSRNRLWMLPAHVPIERVGQTIGGSFVAAGTYIPVNYHRRIIKSMARRSASRFSRWGTIFSSLDCFFGLLRGSEDVVNAVLAAGCTHIIMRRRRSVNWRAHTRSFGVPAVMLGVLELSLELMLFELETEQHLDRLIPPPPSIDPPLEARAGRMLRELSIIPNDRTRQPVWLPPDLADYHHFNVPSRKPF